MDLRHSALGRELEDVDAPCVETVGRCDQLRDGLFCRLLRLRSFIAQGERAKVQSVDRERVQQPRLRLVGKGAVGRQLCAQAPDVFGSDFPDSEFVIPPMA